MTILNVIYVIAAVLALFGAAIFIHEFGHFWVARKLGMKVEGFVPDHPEAFIGGMRVVFLSAAALLLVSIVLTVARARRREEA